MNADYPYMITEINRGFTGFGDYHHAARGGLSTTARSSIRCLGRGSVFSRPTLTST